MTVTKKLQALLNASNAKTGESNTTLTDAVQTLIDGFGQGGGGLPAGIAEYEVQTFTPEADTNEALAFSLNMTEMPTHIIIFTEMPGVVGRSFVSYFGGYPKEDSAGDGTMNMGAGFIEYWAASFISKTVSEPDSNNANRTGVWNLTNTNFTFRSNYYGGQFTYFRAGYTYTIIALRTVAL